jgi:hypothetical protein
MEVVIQESLAALALLVEASLSIFGQLFGVVRPLVEAHTCITGRYDKALSV